MTSGRRVALVLLGAVVLAGCKSKPQWQGRGDVLAIYTATTLTAEFPDEIPVPAVTAAAETALRNRGYAVASSESTRDRGRLEAKMPNPWVLERVIVMSRLSDLGTRVQIRIDPLGDEARARAILDDMLVRLGY
jgi:hypothetical protein